MKIEELKKQMLSGIATAETFEATIKTEGLTAELMGLIFAYYYKEYKDDFDKEAENFGDALAFKGKRDAGVE